MANSKEHSNEQFYYPSLFGLLGYVEPVLVFCVGLLLGERVAASDMPTYLLVMVALLILAIDGLKRARSHGAVK